MDVVETSADAEGLTKPPLLVLDRLRAFLDEQSLGAGAVRARRIGEGGGSNFTLPPRARRGPLRPPASAATAPPAIRARRRPRGAAPARAARSRVRRLPTIVAVCDDEEVIGVPFYVMDELDGIVPTDEPPPGSRATLPVAPRPRPCRCARRDPRSGRADSGARRILTARGLQRASGPPVRAAVADQQDPRAPAGRRGRRAPRRRTARSAAFDRRPRRLPPREHDGRTRRGPQRILAVLDWEMGAIGDPRADVGYLLATYSEPGGLRILSARRR